MPWLVALGIGGMGYQGTANAVSNKRYSTRVWTVEEAAEGEQQVDDTTTRDSG